MSIRQQVTLLMASTFFYSNVFATENTLPSMTDKQTQQLKTQLVQKMKNKQLKQMITDASPTIEKVLSMAACFTPRTAFGMYQSDQDGQELSPINGFSLITTDRNVSMCNAFLTGK